MKKIILPLILCLLSLCSAPAVAQSLRKATAAEQRTMVSRVNAAAKQVRSLTCDFTQTKTLSFLKDKVVSRGKMVYAQSGRLRWEYTSPYAYVLTIADGKVRIKSGKQSQQIDLKSSKLFQSIAQMMVGTITGQCLKEGGDFGIEMYSGGGKMEARLTPKTRDLKAMFSSIRIRFDAAKALPERVEMREKNGDLTVIDLKNVRQNVSVDAKAFVP